MPTDTHIPEKYQHVLNQLRRYCGYQERCLFDLRQKARQLGLTYHELDTLLPVLEAEGFYDEARFAEFFAGGKFRIKKWGRRKIRLRLREKQVPAPLIESALATISEEDYRDTLRRLIRQKMREYGGDPQTKFAKLRRFIEQRGFEYELFRQEFEKLYPRK